MGGETPTKAGAAKFRLGLPLSLTRRILRFIDFFSN